MKQYNKIYETRHGKIICNRLDAYIGGSLEWLGESCELELQGMLKYVHADSVVLDAGANVGTFSVPFAQRSRLVMAFEPEWHNYLALYGNAAINNLPNLRPINAALGAQIGSCKCGVINPHNPGNIGGLHMDQVEDGKPFEIVPVYTVDSLGLPFTVMKIDVENMEDQVLLGALETIRKTKPVIFCEILFQDTAAKVAEILHGEGYNGWKFTTPIYNPDNFNGCVHNQFGDVSNFNAIWIHADSQEPTPDLTEIEK